MKYTFAVVGCFMPIGIVSSTMVIRDKPIGPMHANCLRVTGGTCVKQVLKVLDSLSSVSDMVDEMLVGATRELAGNGRCVTQALVAIRQSLLIPELIYDAMMAYNQNTDPLQGNTEERLRKIIGQGPMKSETTHCSVHRWYNEVFLGNVGATSLAVRISPMSKRLLTSWSQISVAVPPAQALENIFRFHYDKLKSISPGRALPTFVSVKKLIARRDGIPESEVVDIPISLPRSVSMHDELLQQTPDNIPPRESVRSSTRMNSGDSREVVISNSRNSGSTGFLQIPRKRNREDMDDEIHEYSSVHEHGVGTSDNSHPGFHREGLPESEIPVSGTPQWKRTRNHEVQPPVSQPDEWDDEMLELLSHIAEDIL